MRRLFYIVLVLLAATRLIAQEEEIVVHVEITTLAWKEPVRDLFYFNDGQVQEMKAYTGGFSSPIEYVGSPLLKFYKDRSVFSLEKDVRPAPNAVAQIPPGMEKAMLIFIPTDDGRYEILVYDASLESFPGKSYRIYNLSQKRVVFALGDKPKLYTIDPRMTQLIKVSDQSGDRHMVKVQIAQHEESEMRLVYRSMWSAGDDDRSTVFILPDGESNNGIKIYKCTERGISE